MKSSWLASAVFLVGPALLVAGCGGSEATGSDRTVVEVQPTSYVVQDPVTTTTSTTLPLVIEAGTDPNEQLYTIQSGDSVFGIATRFGIAPDVLANYNVWAEGVQHFLQVGDQIKIPPGGRIPGVTPPADPSAPAGSTPASGTTASNGDCPTTYTITADDTTRIKVAKKFDITYQEMDAANANTPGYSSFVVGTPITIPCPIG